MKNRRGCVEECAQLRQSRVAHAGDGVVEDIYLRRCPYLISAAGTFSKHTVSSQIARDVVIRPV